MAFASSVVKAQVPISCDLCESLDTVEWYCTDCEETLCSTCKVSHARSKASRDHNIIPRSQVPKYKAKNIKVNITCKSHEGDKYVLHCKTCDVMVCHKCIMGNHNGHIFTDITEEAESRQKDIDMKLEIISTSVIPKIDLVFQDQKKLKKENQEQINDVQRILLKDKANLKAIVDEIYDEFSRRVDENAKENAEVFQCNEEDLARTKASIQEKTYKWINVMNTDNPQAISQYSKTKQDIDDLLNFETYIRKASPLTYSSGTINKDALRNMFGTLSTLPDQHVQISPIIELKFECEFGVERVVAVNASLAYVSNTARDYIITIDVSKKKDQDIKRTFECKIGAFAVSSAGDFYICNRESKCIEKHQKDKINKAFVNVSDGDPEGVCFTSNGDIIVGTQTNALKGKILRYCCDGALKDKQEGLLNSPAYLCESRNGDICISDSGLEQVVVLNAKFQKRFIYCGYSRQKFSPRGICSDKHGYILVADCSNDRIEMIDENGNFRQLFLTRSSGISDPWSLSIDDEGKLWIGQRTRKGDKNKERVLIVKY